MNERNTVTDTVTATLTDSVSDTLSETVTVTPTDRIYIHNHILNAYQGEGSLKTVGSTDALGSCSGGFLAGARTRILARILWGHSARFRPGVHPLSPIERNHP
jgi:hypothetical protein